MPASAPTRAMSPEETCSGATMALNYVGYGAA
jgi:hypothetical protein